MRTERTVAGPPAETVRFEWLLATGAAAPDSEPEDHQQVADAFRQICRGLFLLSDFNAHAHDDRRMQLTVGGGLGLVAEDGAVTFPTFAPGISRTAWLGTLDTIDEVAAQAGAPDRRVDQ